MNIVYHDKQYTNIILLWNLHPTKTTLFVLYCTVSHFALDANESPPLTFQATAKFHNDTARGSNWKKIKELVILLMPKFLNPTFCPPQDHPNLKYCTKYVSGMELRTHKQMDKQSDY